MSVVEYEEKQITPLELARELVELVRLETDLSYAHSASCVENLVEKICSKLRLEELKPLAKTLKDDILDVDNCSDALRLQRSVDTLRGFSADVQQRSWSVHDDEESILKNLSEMESLLRLADPRVSRRVLTEDNWGGVQAMVEFFQMETRFSIRQALIRVLLEVGKLDATFVSGLLPMVLPAELAQDIATNLQRKIHPESIPAILRLLTLLFSTGEPIPFSHYEVINEDFIRKLLELIESEDGDAGTIDAAISFLISFNLHLVETANPLLDALEQCEDRWRNFGEKLLVLVNNERDPVWSFPDTESPYPSSVIKVLQDIFRRQSIPAKIFYDNDVAVLVEIIVRGIVDFNPSKLRTEYIRLLHLIYDGSEIARSRQSDLEECLQHLKITDSGDYPPQDYEIIAYLEQLST